MTKNHTYRFLLVVAALLMILAIGVSYPNLAEAAHECGGFTDDYWCWHPNPYPCGPHGDSDYTDKNDGNCTWWAWHMMCSRWQWSSTNPAPGNWENPEMWLTNASSDDFPTGIEPRANSVFVWTGGLYEHVGWVFKVDSGYVYTTEMQYYGWEQYTNENGPPNEDQGYRIRSREKMISLGTHYIYEKQSGPHTATIPVTDVSGSMAGQITDYQVSRNPAGVGDAISFRVTVKNTGNISHAFVAGLSVWKVGSSISTSIIDTNQQVTLSPNQQQTLTLRTYSFSSNQTGEWYYQFGLWKDQAGGTLLQKAPSPAGVLAIAAFLIGDRVQTTQNLNVRNGPGVSYSEITDPDYPQYAPTATLGSVMEGPVSANGYVWWKVQYDRGYAGWSVENGLSKI